MKGERWRRDSEASGKAAGKEKKYKGADLTWPIRSGIRGLGYMLSFRRGGRARGGLATGLIWGGE